MNPLPSPRAAGYRRDPVAYAALLLALLAIVSSLSGQAPADPGAAKRKAAGKGLSRKLANLHTKCPITNSIKFGSWCLESSPHSIPAADVGENDYFYATQVCAREGGWLPTAAQLIGAAPQGRRCRARSTTTPAPRGPRNSPTPPAASSTNAR